MLTAGSAILGGRGKAMAVSMIGAVPTPRSSSFTGWVVTSLVWLCTLVPYALIAFGLRFVVARVFFLSGQTMIDGPAIPLGGAGRDFNVSIILPAEIKDATFQIFQTQYAALPMSPTVAAYLFSYAEFVLPICLVFGFATRFAALGLLALTVLVSYYVMPEAFWSTHVYWIAILMVLVSIGPGAISIDAFIRYLHER
jgi:putative oxidoreductase